MPLRWGFLRMDVRRHCGCGNTDRHACKGRLQRCQGEEEQDEEAAHESGAAGMEGQALSSTCPF